MRVLLLLVPVLLMPLSAMAAGWSHYSNARFGYAIDVPPGFIGQGESANGDGQAFKTPTATLRVFGRYIVDGGFEDQVRAEQDYAKQDGWAITYAVSTPRYASFSGVKAGRVSYTRMIPLCGDAFAEFDLAYSKADIQKFNPSIDQLVASLKPTDGSAACPRKP